MIPVPNLIIFLLIGQLVLAFAGPAIDSKSRFAEIYNLRNRHRDRRHQDSNQEEPDTTCGYASCPRLDPNRLNVHIIAHTHDDVGWLKTVDQYFYGTRKHDSQAGVQFILDSVIPQLLMDKDKRFIYVEMSFFSKWWDEQDDDMKNVVRRLVNEGRLEFINGGWCMNDEATVTYHSTIEQMTLGLKFLNESFGACAHPKVGWQIDPFGHTSEQASLFAQFGFDGMFFTRIDYKDKERRASNKSLDLIWHGDRGLPAQTGSIFTNVFRDGYDAPNGYCFDSLCKDDLIVDNKKSYEYNIEHRGQYIISFIRRYSDAKLTNQLLLPFGGDFQYSAAGQNFRSLDKLMRYIRENAPDINIFYSTPSCYQYAIHDYINQKRINLPEKYDDFMPYDSSSTVWWSGYFSSRPSVKLIERETADLLQVSRLVSVSNLIESQTTFATESNATTRKNKQGKPRQVTLDQIAAHERDCLNPLWEILGDLQHHDAITGTEKQHVANDYVRRVTDASKLCARFLGKQKRRKVSALLNKSDETYDRLASSSHKFDVDPIYLEDTSFCSLNISQCEPMEVPIDRCHYLRYGINSAADQQLCAQSPSMYLLTSSRRNLKVTPRELERKGVLVTIYNPLASPVKKYDIRLPCIGRCNLDKIKIIHLATNETMKLTRFSLPSGIDSLPFRNSLAKYEISFYVNIPPLGSTSFAISDTNEEDFVDDEASSEMSSSPGRAKRSSDISSDCDHCESLAKDRFDYIQVSGGLGNIGSPKLTSQDSRIKRDDEHQHHDGIGSDRIIVKLDTQTGMIMGLKRASDGSFLNITQKFGTYEPNNPDGAYIFRPSTLEPHLLPKPITFKLVKRHNGSLIEIHQKWSDWIWQTIRVDGTKNYIEFDYVIGPIPTEAGKGLEVITRYITNLPNQGIFFTDSGARQMLPRRKLSDETPEQLGGSFYPVVASMLIRSIRNSSSPKPTNETSQVKSAEAVAILVDRPQAASSLNEGNLEFLIHRRLTADDNFGVGEPLNEPGEDGRGLVTRGRHRLFLKFPSTQSGETEEVRQILDTPARHPIKVQKLPRTPRSNITYELGVSREKVKSQMHNGEANVYIVHDQLLNDLRQESVKYALKPVLVFDRLRATASEFVKMLSKSDRADFSLLNNTLPSNIHLLTLQPWKRKSNELLIRLENLDNPLTLTQFPSRAIYNKLLYTYGINEAIKINASQEESRSGDACQSGQETRFSIEYMINRIRFVSLEEYNLGANARLADDNRLDWTQERDEASNACDTSSDRATTVRLLPRQIRTYLAQYEFI